MEAVEAYGQWGFVAANVVFFLFFIVSFLAPKGWAEWRSMGATSAFLVALFSEMYGFPLTIYLLSGWLGDNYPVLEPLSHKNGHLWVALSGGSLVVWGLVMIVSSLLLIAGYLLLGRGWRQIHWADGELVTGGLYAWVRHPQYTAFFLIIAGFLIQWPTLLTVLMAPLLIVAYQRLALREERLLLERFGDRYERYRQCTPRFFPSFRALRGWWNAHSRLNKPIRRR